MKFKIGDFIKKEDKDGGVTKTTQGFIYAVDKLGRVKLKDKYGNKDNRWREISGFRKKKTGLEKYIKDPKKLKYAKFRVKNIKEDSPKSRIKGRSDWSLLIDSLMKAKKPRKSEKRNNRSDIDPFLKI